MCAVHFLVSLFMNCTTQLKNSVFESQIETFKVLRVSNLVSICPTTLNLEPSIMELNPSVGFSPGEIITANCPFVHVICDEKKALFCDYCLLTR